MRGDQACTTHISTDDGRSWAPGGALMVKPFLDCTIGAEYGAYASPAFGSDGTLYVAFIGSEFLGRLRDDTPRTFPPLPAGQLNAVRPILYRQSTDQGRTWTDAVEVDPGNQRSGSPRPPVLAADPRTGTLYTAWYSNTEPNNLAPGYEGDLEIFFRRSTDGGRTWGQRVVLNDDGPGKANQFLPGIAVAPDGRVDVAWYDGRVSPKPRAGGTGGNETGFQDVYATSSTDQGVTFGPNLRITDRSIDRSGRRVVEQHREQPRRGCDFHRRQRVLRLAGLPGVGPGGAGRGIYMASLKMEGAATIAQADDGVPSWAFMTVGLVLGMGIAMTLAWLFSRRSSRSAVSSSSRSGSTHTAPGGARAA